MSRNSSLSATTGFVALAVTATLMLAACTPTGEPTPAPEQPESDVNTAATGPDEPAADSAFVCGQLNALEAARWRAAIDEGKGLLDEGASEAVQNSVFDGYATIMQRAPGELSSEVEKLKAASEADPRDPEAVDEASRALGTACEEAGVPLAILARPGDGG